MSGIPNHKTLETSSLTGDDQRKELGNRNRHVRGVDSDPSPSSSGQTGIKASATSGIAADEAIVNDGVGGHPLGDLNQHNRAFKLPRFEIKDNEGPFHSLRPRRDAATDLSHAYANLLREDSEVDDFRDAQEEISLPIPASNAKKHSHEELSYHSGISQSSISKQVREPWNTDGEITVPRRIKFVSNSRRYQGLWPRAYYRPRHYRSGYIPMSIAERIFAHDSSFDPTSVTPKIAIPAPVLVPRSSMDPSVESLHHFVLPNLGRDRNSNRRQFSPQPSVSTSYDGGAPTPNYITGMSFEPSVLESIYEDASDYPIPTTSRAKRRALKNRRKMTSNSPVESERRAGGYFHSSPTPSERPVTPTEPHDFTGVKLKGESPHLPKEHEAEFLKRRSRRSAEQTQVISSSNSITAEIATSSQQVTAKPGWLSFKKSPPLKTASSSIYSQSDSPSVKSKIAYERLPSQNVVPQDAIETISCSQHEEDTDEARTSLMAQPSESESSRMAPNSRKLISQYTSLFTCLPSTKRSAREYMINSSSSTVKQTKAPFKPSPLKRFSRKVRPGLSEIPLEKVSTENVVLESPVHPMFGEDKTNPTATDKFISSMTEKRKQYVPVNWFDDILSFHKNSTADSTTRLANRKKDLKLSKELVEPRNSDSLAIRRAEDAETLMMMIEDLEKRLDEALYPALRASDRVDAVIYADVPQKQVTRGRELPRKRPQKFGSLLQRYRYIQPELQSNADRDHKNGMRSHFEKVSYGSDKHGAMRHNPIPVNFGLPYNETDGMSWRMSDERLLTNTPTLPSTTTSDIEPSEQTPDITSDLLSDNVILNPPGNSGFSTEVSDRVHKMAIVTSPSRIVPQQKKTRNTGLATNGKKWTAVATQTNEQVLNKDKILRFVTAHNFPPIQRRYSSRAGGIPRRHDPKSNVQVPAQGSSRSLGTRALREHASMDGAQEADDEMESDTEYVLLRRRRKMANIRCRRINRDDSHYMRSLRRGGATTARQTPDWPLRDPPTLLRRGERPQNSSDSQREFFISRSRRYSGARDLSAADERFVTLAAVVSIVLIMALISVYIFFGAFTRHLPTTWT